MKAIDLDHTATTPVDPEVFAAMLPFLIRRGAFAARQYRHLADRTSRLATAAANRADAWRSMSGTVSTGRLTGLGEVP